MKNKEQDNVIYFDKNAHKTINKKRLIGLIILLLIILLIVITYILYATNENIRGYIDKNILRKEITQSNLKSIEIKDYDKLNIFAYYNKIAILKDNTLSLYNQSAKKETDLKVEISTPITYSCGRYFIIGEKGSSKVYLMKENEIVWEKNLEGNISRVTVNEAGYTAAVLTGTANKSVIIVFDEKGTELFKYYLSKTIAIDLSISSDCKNLAFAEINTAGTLIQSNVKILSVEKTKTAPDEALIYTYNAEQNSLILSLKYSYGNKLVCMYDDSVQLIKDNTDSKIVDITQKENKITYYSIQLDNNVATVQEESAGLLSTQTTVKIINTSNQKQSEYKFEGVTRDLYTYGNNIALNLGSEIHFIRTNGWLVKKYTSSQEIRKIVLTDAIAGIVYRNKIEIVNL